MYKSTRTTQFRRDAKRCKKRNKPQKKFEDIHELLISGIPLPPKNKDHALAGNWAGHHECHIEPDWLLIYRINEEEKTIEYIRMGSHADMFE
ncbi:MAG: type II toxin-antitoxin system YafQ family toxin [Rhodospirillales bacterium]|nr:type II toxin-antitoxin system YafQ family toxin [Rhodospirillales bacterium]